MTQPFKSTNELMEYLGVLEERVKTLEAQNAKLASVPQKIDNVDGNAISRVVSHYMPRTNLVNPNFLKRAFTVWGHFFVANLIIGVIIGIGYACLMLVILGPLFGSLLQNSR